MYKIVGTDKEIIWNSVLHPLLALADEYGGRAQIVRDDHCLVLLMMVNEDGKGESYPAYYKPTAWWFKEAVTAVITELADEVWDTPELIGEQNEPE